jgi:hypothetical protein
MSQAEEPCLYTLQLTLTANQALKNQKVPIDPDSEYVLTGIHGTSTGTYTLNFKLPSGRSLANNQVTNADLIGTAQQPTAIGPTPVYLPDSVGPAVDITDTSGAGNTIEICFTGIRRFSKR